MMITKTPDVCQCNKFQYKLSSIRLHI